MPISNAKMSGTLLLVGAGEFTIASTIAQSIYPNYSVSANYISDLGVWGTPSAPIFNISIMLFGVLVLASTYFIQRFGKRAITILFAVSGSGTLAVGIFPENTFLVGGIPVAHTIAALMAFAGEALAALAVYRITKPPFRYISVILGLASLTALFLLVFTVDSNWLGLGGGGMERMIAYPSLVWLLGFSGYLIGKSEA